MPAVSAPLVRLVHIKKTYGTVRALWNIDLAIHPGDFTAVFGPNGAGKTTLLRLIACLTDPTSGRIEFTAGGNLGRDRVGYVSHQSLLYNELSGHENLLFYGRLYGIADPHRQAAAMLSKMGLEEAAHRKVRGFSRGMKQRLTLGRALLHGPELLLLDEPYSGLDQHGSRLLTEVLQGLRDDGRTVLLITHNLGEGLALCTRVLIQNRGEVVFDAPREQLDQQRFEQLYFEVVAEPSRSRTGRA